MEGWKDGRMEGWKDEMVGIEFSEIEEEIIWNEMR